MPWTEVSAIRHTVTIGPAIVGWKLCFRLERSSGQEWGLYRETIPGRLSPTVSALIQSMIFLLFHVSSKDGLTNLVCFSGIFSQSNFGIVTKMGMTLMPNPGGYESYVSYRTWSKIPSSIR